MKTLKEINLPDEIVYVSHTEEAFMESKNLKKLIEWCQEQLKIQERIDS